jgi:hypothetical protein
MAGVLTVVAFLVLLGIAGFGVFLLVAAPDTPVPGLIALSLVAFSFWCLRRIRTKSASRTSSNCFDGSAFEALERDRLDIDYEAQRRARGEFDAAPLDSDTHTSDS